MRKARRGKAPLPRAKRTPKTVYLDPRVARAISVIAALNGKSFSDVMSELAVRRLREDERHIRIFKARSGRPARSYDDVVKELRRDGLL